MCDYCGCAGVPAVGELIAEHAALLEESHRVKAALRAGDRAGGRALLIRLVAHLDRHVRREETGLFTALREQGEYVDEVASLEADHLDLDATIASLDASAPEFDERVTGMLDELTRHIEREELGVFPVSVVTLGAPGWDLVERAHRRTPTFLSEPGERQTVADCMVTTPTTLAPDVTVGAVRAAFRDDHLHMVLLTRAGTLVGTLVREDLPGRADSDRADSDPALPLSRLAGRTVAPAASADEARHVLVSGGARRLAVVDADGTLLGLLCLKRHGRGFCSDLDVAARALDRGQDREREALSCA